MSDFDLYELVHKVEELSRQVDMFNGYVTCLCILFLLLLIGGVIIFIFDYFQKNN